MPKGLRKLCPVISYRSLVEVPLEDLWASGKRLVMLDVDNTILPWRSEKFSPEILEWLERGKALGLRFCLVSNTSNYDRLDRVAGVLSLPAYKGKPKPSREMYFQALQEHGITAERAVMIGDQLLTDILGANRSRIDGIWVKPISRREFLPTRLVSRSVERVVRLMLRRFMEPAENSTDAPFLPMVGLFRYKVVRQFLKFATVGVSSTVVDLGLHFVLMFKVPVGDRSLGEAVGTWMAHFLVGRAPVDLAEAYAFGYTPLKVLPVVLAILNSFYWNRRWTFRVRGKAGIPIQVTKFYTVALIGMVLNLAISTTVAHIVPLPPKESWAAASLAAMVVVVFWNFFGQKLWTFRKVSS